MTAEPDSQEPQPGTEAPATNNRSEDRSTGEDSSGGANRNADRASERASSEHDDAADREDRLRELTEQCLDLLDQLADARQELAEARGAASFEDQVTLARDRFAWLSDIVGGMQLASQEADIPELSRLRAQILQSAQELRSSDDIDGLSQRLGQGLELEHQMKSALTNMVLRLQQTAKDSEQLHRQIAELETRAHAAEELLQTLNDELSMSRRDIVDLAARSDAPERDGAGLGQDAEGDRSSLEAVETALRKLRNDNRAIRQIRAILGLVEDDEDHEDDTIVQSVRDMRNTLVDRDRWVISLLGELSRRRFKLSRRGLMEHEQKFLEERGDETKDK